MRRRGGATRRRVPGGRGRGTRRRWGQTRQRTALGDTDRRELRDGLRCAAPEGVGEAPCTSKGLAGKKKRPNGPSRQRGDRSSNLSQAGRGCAKWISLMLERPRPAAAHALRHCGGYAPMRRCPRRPGSCCRRARAGGADLLPCSGRRRLSRHALWGSSARARASRCGRPGWQK